MCPHSKPSRGKPGQIPRKEEEGDKTSTNFVEIKIRENPSRGIENLNSHEFKRRSKETIQKIFTNFFFFGRDRTQTTLLCQKILYLGLT